MSDQSQNDQKPTLTLEEELDVLEAVYRVGKEKGLDLLRPEQVKKLLESGRMGKEGKSEELIAKKISPNNVRIVVRNMIKSLLSQYPEITDNDEWRSFSEYEKEQVTRTLFGIHFGISIEELSQRTKLLLSGTELNYG